MSAKVFKSVQLLVDNYDIENNPKVREKYPMLYNAVINQTPDKNSYYDFTQEEYEQWCEYREDQSLGYMRKK
ncbi:MAG: hypothetical protein J6A25_07215 [Lachnospiraceae bacterium]|nr:hypothetical protein [Lachnospiraceae bacterium]